MSEEYSIADSKQTDFGFQVDAQENPGGTPEARSLLCVLSGFLPHGLCHGRDSSHWLLEPILHSIKKNETKRNRYLLLRNKLYLK